MVLEHLSEVLLSVLFSGIWSQRRGFLVRRRDFHGDLPTGRMAVGGPIGSKWGPWLSGGEDRGSQAAVSSLCLPLQQAGTLTPGGMGRQHSGGPSLDHSGPDPEHGELGTRRGRYQCTCICAPQCSCGPGVGRSRAVPGRWHSCTVFWRQGIHPLAWGWGWGWAYKILFPWAACPPSLAVGTNHTWMEGRARWRMGGFLRSV